MHRIIDRQQDQPERPRDREEDGRHGAELVEEPLISRQHSPVSQPTLRQEGQVEEHDGDGASGDEEGFQTFGANVGNEADSTVSSICEIGSGNIGHTRSSAGETCCGSAASPEQPMCLSLRPAWLIVGNKLSASCDL